MRAQVSARMPGAPTVPTMGSTWRAGWPIYVPYAGLLILWALGFTYFIWPIIGATLLFRLMLRGTVRVPRGFGIWLLFLAWMLVSASQVQSASRWMAWGYRGSMYLSATAVFLYIFNARRESLPTPTVVNALAAGWAMVVIGGLLGIFSPSVTLKSAAELVLPHSLLAIPFVHDIVTPVFAQGRVFHAFPIHRTQAPFPYPNAWGSNFAILTPFALWAMQTTTRRWRVILRALLVASLVPLFFSLDRGAWLGLAAGLTYAGIRVALKRDARTLRRLFLAAVVIGVVLFASPLGKILLIRLQHGYSDQGRLARDIAALTLVKTSPILGFGTPISSDLNPTNASVGTHGQLFLVLVSQGIPGLMLFAWWLLYLLVRTGRRIRGVWDPRFWPHVVIFTAVAMSPFYELLPMQLFTISIAAALSFREAGASRAAAVQSTGLRIPQPTPRARVKATAAPRLTRVRGTGLEPGS